MKKRMSTKTLVLFSVSALDVGFTTTASVASAVTAHPAPALNGISN